MSIDQSKREFDNWYAVHTANWPTGIAGVECCKDVFREAWDASRASLVVDLPEAWRSAGSTHELMHKRDTIAAIEAAGVKCK